MGGLHFGSYVSEFLAFPWAWLCLSAVLLIPPPRPLTCATCLLTYLSTYLYVCPPTYLYTYLSADLPVCLPVARPIDLYACRPVDQKCCTIICIMLNRIVLTSIDMSTNRPTEMNASKPIAHL